jgi:xanthine dehydrogenase YagT iron-sulfur-binding subunit
MTIEGLSADGELHPLQAAFVKHDGFQCGYCTPGQICSAIGLSEEIQERMSGNLCRCGAYIGIRSVIREAFPPEVAQ